MRKIVILLFCTLWHTTMSAQNTSSVQPLPVATNSDFQQIDPGKSEGQSQVMAVQSSAEDQDPPATTIMEANPALVTALASPNLYSGTLGVQIPIYTINTRGISVPITLLYNGGGLKNTDISSWVGAGWNLSAGGQISRMKRDKLDETDNDDERDVFSFNLPGGLSGLFVFDKNWNVQTIPYQNLDIAWNRTANTFTIKDLNGLTYELDVKETDVDKDNKTTTVSWLLSRIKDYTGKVLVEFAYDYSAQMDYNSFTGGKFIQAQDGLSHLGSVVATQYDTETTKKNLKFLSQIIWDGGKLSFESIAHTNENGSSRKLEKIHLYAKDKSSLIKVVGLDYKNFPQSKRLQLFSLLDATTSTPVLLYRMFYYNTYANTSPTVSQHTDHWGYFRGATLGAPAFPAKVWSETGARYTYVGAFQSEGRDPDIEYTKIDALKMIELVPTGARKLFDYELHDANNFPDPVGGLRIKSIIETDNANSYYYKTRYEYKNSTGKSSGELYCPNPVNFYLQETNIGSVIQLCNFLFNIQDITGNYIGYSQVKTINPNNSYTITKFTNHSTYPDVQEAITGIQQLLLLGHSYNKHVLWKTSNAYKRGLPTEIISYDASGTQVSRQVNIYGFGPEKGRVTSIQELTIKWLSVKYALKTNYHWISVPIMLQSTTIDIKGQIPVTTTYTYNTTYNLPKEVTSVSGGVTQTTKILYPFDYDTSSPYVNTSDPVSWCSAAISTMKQYRVLNAPVEKIYYKDSKLVGAELTGYRLALIGSSTLSVPGMRGILNLQTGESNPNFGSKISGGLFTCDPRYEFVESIDEFDPELRPISIRDNCGHKKSVIYNTLSDVPIAAVDNASYSLGTGRNNQVFHTSFEDDSNASQSPLAKSGTKVKSGTFWVPMANFIPGNYTLSYWKSANSGSTWEQVIVPITVTGSTTGYSIGGSGWIDEVRMMPADARMTTAAYSLQGYKISETDANGGTIYWEYDNMGRVTRILDNLRNPISKYEYTINQ